MCIYMQCKMGVNVIVRTSELLLCNLDGYTCNVLGGISVVKHLYQVIVVFFNRSL